MDARPDAPSNPARLIPLVLYSRVGCHLCDETQQALEQLQELCGFRLQVLDVDEDPLLEQRHGWFVPVLMYQDQEIFHYRMDRDKLEAFLLNLRDPKIPA